MVNDLFVGIKVGHNIFDLNKKIPSVNNKLFLKRKFY